MSKNFFTTLFAILVLMIGTASFAPITHATPCGIPDTIDTTDCTDPAAPYCDDGEQCSAVPTQSAGNTVQTQSAGNTVQTQSAGNTITTGTNPSTTLINPLQGNCSSNGNCLESFLQSILAFVVKIGAIVVVLMLVFVGYKFVAAQGNEEALKDARRMLLWTVIGALILLGAQAISLGIQATVNAISTGTTGN
jgi:hypothetical protein